MPDPGHGSSRRTLILSLLRAGDALVHLRAVEALRNADPGAELHLLLQASGLPVRELLSSHAKVHLLPSDHLGGPLGPCEPLVVALRQSHFDLVVNLTHRRFAAELSSSIGGDRTLGSFVISGRTAVSSPWLSALNDWGTTSQLSVLHYADVASQSLGLAGRDPPVAERLPPESERWWKSTQEGLLHASGRPFIAFQLSTSEPKKTYPLPRFRELCVLLARLAPDLDQLAMVAPGEASKVSDALRGTRAKMVTCSLTQAARLLKDAALLVSGDTVLVHLASLVKTRVLLLSSGSSAFRELGPLGDGHAILQARWPCAPCPHDPGCVAASSGYPCAEAADPGTVARLCVAMLSNEALPVPGQGERTNLFCSGFDRRGLADYRPIGLAPPDTACAEIFRDYLLEDLPVAEVPHGAVPLELRRPGRDELKAAGELSLVAQTLREEALGHDLGALQRLIPSLTSPFALSFLMASRKKLGEAPAPNPALARDMERLLKRIALRVST